jgi:spore maturation protein CgeB
VPSLRRDERRDLYFRSKIGVNLHLSNVPRETGNMRMYEVPEHGAMLLCDKAGRDAHAQIFDPNREAVFYDSIDDAIEKAEHYLKKADDRVAIARAGFDRVWKDYEWGLRLKGLLDWASGLRKKSQ